MTQKKEVVVPDIVILGAGLAGLSAAFHLKKDSRIFEKNDRVGGLCRSEVIDGFVFDYAPHILFPKYEYAARLIKDLLQDNLLIQSREAWIFHRSCGLFTRFPFQAHLHGLPVSVVKDCLLGLFNATMREKERTSLPKNYREWIEWTFGDGIAAHLMFPYAEKLWTVDPEVMNFDWVKNRVPRPKLEDVLEGALAENPRKFGFNTAFWYPLRGGIEALPQSFLPRLANIHLEKRATRIDTKTKQIIFNDEERVSFDQLISTLPPQEILKLCDRVPEDVKKASENLMHNSVLCVNLGIDREKITDKQWIYYHENEFSFHRISFPMNFSPWTCPKNTSSVCTEISYSPTKPLHKDNIVERVREDLIKGQILYPDDTILVSNVLDMKYAYIIYDHDHRKNVAKIHGFLRSCDIYPCGRFGEWEYFNMDDTLESGRKTAEIINRMLLA